NSGICTLRAAIQEVNARPGGDAINFNSSLSSIHVNSTLAITKAVPLDSGSNRVEITGAGFSVSAPGGTTIRGLVINSLSTNFSSAISLNSNSGPNFIENNYIGTDVSGSNPAFGSATSWDGTEANGSPN